MSFKLLSGFLLTATAPLIPSSVIAQARMTAAEKATCVATGGRLGILGFFRNEHCFRKMKDAGKICRDGAQCESGYCEAVKDKNGRMPQPGKKAKGMCAPTNEGAFGTHQFINNGKAALGFSVD